MNAAAQIYRVMPTQANVAVNQVLKASHAINVLMAFMDFRIKVVNVSIKKKTIPQFIWFVTEVN